MIKQASGLIPTCKCGQPMVFPEGVNVSRCLAKGCGLRWERGPEGYWAIGLFTLIFIPIITKEIKAKLNHYERYMRWRNSRKAGSRC